MSKTKIKKHMFYSLGTVLPSIAIAPIFVTSCNNNSDITKPSISTNNDTDFFQKIEETEINATSLAKQKTAYGWEVKDIVDKYFTGIPKSGNGMMVKILSVDNYPNEQKIDITIQFSTLGQNHVSIVKETKIYEVFGFRKETLDEKVDRVYENVNIIPTKESIQIPALPENWTLSDINDDNFKNLPKDKEGVKANLLELSFDDSDPLQGKIILTYQFFVYEGMHSITRQYVIEGFEKASYNSNVAAQNHYKLVALYRMVDVKNNINRSKINTDEIENGGMEKVKEIFDLPEDRKYNVVTLVDVISSEDNTLDTYKKGKNMDLGTVKLKFSIFDWVNNKRSFVETDIFKNFENPLNYWNDLFKSVSLSSAISDSIFSISKFYETYKPYSTTTHDDDTNSNVLNGTDAAKGNLSHLGSYLLPLADWVGYKKSTYAPMYGHGESQFGMKNIKPDHQRFVNMITYDAKNNYIGNGPDKSNSLDTPINQGGISEILRKYIFNNIKNQELYQYDWIVFNKLIEPSYADKHLSWTSQSRDGIPFGYNSVWINTTFEYDIWLDYTRTTIRFDASLGMLDKAKNGGSDSGWTRT